MNWMELCATSDGSGVVYALGKPIKPQEKTRILFVETPTGGRARAWTERTTQQNLDSCAGIKSDMDISGELSPQGGIFDEQPKIRCRFWSET